MTLRDEGESILIPWRSIMGYRAFGPTRYDPSLIRSCSSRARLGAHLALYSASLRTLDILEQAVKMNREETVSPALASLIMPGGLMIWYFCMSFEIQVQLTMPFPCSAGSVTYLCTEEQNRSIRLLM
uniref:Uncharacterized protein n=1 Tax=Oryza meridionalis TaxID=40149 RepID=A0A0E0FB24_9ORYZ